MHRIHTKMTYLNSAEGHIIHVVDHTQQTVRESNESSTKQKDEVMLIQTHLRSVTIERVWVFFLLLG